MQDYSAHKINADLKLREVQKHLLKNNFNAAIEDISEVIVQLRMMKASITDLMEKRNERD